MTAALPIEIVDLILRLSLEPALLSIKGAPSSSQLDQAASSSPTKPSCITKQPVDTRHASVVIALSRHHRTAFQSELYRHITLSSLRSISLFDRTIAARPELGRLVRSLAIFSDEKGRSTDTAVTHPDTEAESPTIPLTSADAILSACPNASHLLLSCNRLTDLPTGLYTLLRPKELTLIDVRHEHDLAGIVTRHRDLSAAALQNDPRMRSVLGSAARTISPTSTAEAPTPTIDGERSLSHLHLVNFDARLLHHLVTLSSLTHLVLTHPHVPERRPGAPGLAVIPRSHLLLLLGSGNVARITIRADLRTCIRIMDEVAPIEDRKLVFRPIRSEGDALFPEEIRAASPSSRLGSQANALHDSIKSRKLDLLAEYQTRLRAYRSRSQAPSSGDPDTSRDSSSQYRSSDSSRDGISHSASTGSGSDDTGEVVRIAQQEEDEGSDGYDDDDGAFAGVDDSRSRHEGTAQASAAPRFTNAPPLNIPIEELLRSEGFTPVGFAGPAAPPSHISSGTEQSSSGSPDDGTTASSTARQRRQRRLLRETPFTLRRTDLRGATQHNVDLCTQVLEVLAEEAGVSAGMQPEMGVW